ncbi:MAG: DUF2339 domain-containing protein [Akkermansiaceae bacterium]
MNSNPSLTSRLTRAELDLRALHEEARRLGITLSEIKDLLEQEKAIPKRAVAKVEEVQKEPTPQPPAQPMLKKLKADPGLVATDREKKESEKPAPPVLKTPVYSAQLEMELGRVWSVRLGIVLLTTGLVFLSSYTYKNWIYDLSPSVRLGLLYLVSFVLTGGGLFCERWKNSLKTYGRIVAAGGLAATYYTSYAAYNVEPLKVIESPVSASILLLLTAGFCGGVSLSRNSRLMLGASAALAFYSLLLNPVGWMVGLFALVLSAGACAVGRLKEWRELFFISIIGSYACYGWWELSLDSLAPAAPFFLVAFWLLFVSLSFFEKFKEHAIFCGLNHAAFTFLYSFNLQSQDWIEGHWIFCLIFGTILLAIGILTRQKLPKNSILLHLTKGLSFVTLGIILKLSGHALFMTLLFEAVMLSAIQLRVKHIVVKAASLTVAVIAILTGSHYGMPAPPIAWFFTGLLWGAFGLLQRLADPPEKAETNHILGLIGYTGLFLAMIFGTARNVNPELIILSLGGIGLVVTLLKKCTVNLNYLIDFYLVAQIIMIIALSMLFGFSQDPLVFLIGFIFTMTASFLHRDTWLRATDDKIREFEKHFASLHYGFSIILLGISAHFGIEHHDARMVTAYAIPLAGVLLATQTRWWIHAVFPYLAYLCLPQVIVFETAPLSIGLLILVIQLVALRKWDSFKMGSLLEPLTFLISAITGFFWMASLSNETHDVMPLMAWAGVGILLLDRLYSRSLVTFSATPFIIFGVIGSLILNIFNGRSDSLPYLAILPVIALHLWSSFRERKPSHHIFGILSLLWLWLLVSNNVGSENYSASWAVLGTLSLLTGLILKSRHFRMVALVILGFSLGHVMFIDLGKLDPFPRILSFITLGVGLLGLGFVYNRWQEKLKTIL